MNPDDFENESVRLSLANLEAPSFENMAAPTSGLLIRILFQPSFHPDVLLTLHCRQGEGDLELRCKPRVGSGHARLVREYVLLPEPDNVLFRLEEFSLWDIQDLPARGIDGMNVRCFIADQITFNSFECWSPQPNTIQHKLLSLVYFLGTDNLSQENSIQALEHLHTYLELALPIRLQENDDFQTLRIFSSLSWGMEDDLRLVFARVLSHKPLLVDMSNFDSMGALLFPYFIEFARAFPRAVWLLNEQVLEQFKEMRFPGQTITLERGEAMGWIEGLVE